MASKESIANLTLGALLLQRRIIDFATDKGNEINVIRTHFDTALKATLADMDLDSTSGYYTLEKIDTFPADDWMYCYKYPSDCAFLRRIWSGNQMDTPETLVPKHVRIYDGQKVIFTNRDLARAEMIFANIDLTTLSANAEYAIALNLARMSAPLIVGKGAKTLIQQIDAKYLIAKTEAQEIDSRENFQFVPPEVESSWAAFRIS